MKIKIPPKSIKKNRAGGGLCKKHEVPVGEFRWITLVSSDDQDGNTFARTE